MVQIKAVVADNHAQPGGISGYIGKQLHSIPYFSILLYKVLRSILSIWAALLLLYFAFCSTSTMSFRSCASLCSLRSGLSAVGTVVFSAGRLMAYTISSGK